MCKRNTRELGRPDSFLAAARKVKPTEMIGELKTSWESDQFIVLGERESRFTRGRG
jgi:hypothetical protein